MYILIIFKTINYFNGTLYIYIYIFYYFRGCAQKRCVGFSSIFSVLLIICFLSTYHFLSGDHKISLIGKSLHILSRKVNVVIPI